MLKSIGIAALLLSVSGAALANGQDCKTKTVWVFGLFPIKEQVCEITKRTAVAPEFDAATAAGGVTLFAGGLAIFLGRRRSKVAA